METGRSIFVTSLLLIFCVFFYETWACNEVVCASIVSKCMLTQSCRCEFKQNCSCCKECLKCLGKYYDECCSCVELCPKPNGTRNALSTKSHVEDFDGVPELFNVLVADSDADTYGWDTFTFQVDFDAIMSGPKLEKDSNYFLRTNVQSLDENDNTITKNCTVIYVEKCISWHKCRETCHKTGANSYRWFHDGCCECVGSYCINYGINDSRCRYCPESKDGLDDLDENIDEDLQDFGDGVGPFDGTVNSNY